MRGSRVFLHCELKGLMQPGLVMLHKIHIPVMGVCYTVDTPIRVAHLGLTSVISLVDDGLLEEYRMAYGERLGVDVGSPQTTRIGRIRSYLDFMADEVQRKFEWICGMRIARCVEDGGIPCSGATCVELTEKDRYFLMLPADSPLRAEYDLVCSKKGLARVLAEMELTQKMEVGEIQANIMVNLNHEEAALDAVRGFAASKVCGSLVLSAGVNLGVFEEMAKYDCFYRKGNVSKTIGTAPQKKIVLKVSDYRSALIQSRYLAKKGLEVYEFRIESGVNCGGHAFCESKKLMPDVLKEFVVHKQELFETARKMIAGFAERHPDANIALPSEPARITAQGGLCSAQEIEDVLSLGADGVGVGTPFLLVPQATSADAETRALLAAATRDDVQLTHASPLGVPFMNLVTSTAAEICRRKTDAFFKNRSQEAETLGPKASEAALANAFETAPGFPCRGHYLCRNIPGFNRPVCMASREYVLHRLAEIDNEETEALNALKFAQSNVADGANPNALECVLSGATERTSPVAGETSRFDAQNLAAGELRDAASIREKFDALRRETLSRECICRFLGNAGREEILSKNPTPNYEREKIAVMRGVRTARVKEPVTICPGPNIAYFNREYTLLEMMQHLYGTGPALTPADKPHAFDVEKEIWARVPQV